MAETLIAGEISEDDSPPLSLSEIALKATPYGADKSLVLPLTINNQDIASHQLGD